MSIAGAILLLVLAANLWITVAARHRRIAAEAQLEIARCVSDVEERMLAGQIRVGNVCHDRMFKRMVEIQDAAKLGVRWNWWRKPSQEDIEIRALVESELAAGSELGSLLRRYSLATLTQFRYQRPVIAATFLLWLLVTGLSLAALLGACFATIQSVFSLLHLGRLFTAYVDGKCAPLAAGWSQYVLHAQQTYLWGYARTSSAD